LPVLAEQAAEQRHEGDADEGDTAACHELLHTLGLTTVGIKKFSDKHCKTGTASYFIFKVCKCSYYRHEYVSRIVY